ncbi:toll/interleukin-1 receptor domain-containing protein [Pseudoduganella buxea]|uniref:TIR domain-containing protein n=1 Tax=Pseudoduganella buxea TaxID=1949069 RepID=A0A6I3T4C8_9BURK|nr:toll/interleukin-1 receptor domain-containing protein [Pseudoduganella buxea]MTV56269.1 TIR domain-containing protein [Pseudoduganella buxea]
MSYAWTYNAHRAWVRLVAVQLRLLGYTVQIDEAVVYGSSLSNFMREVATADRVLMIVDENYVDRADNLPGSGVAIENRWIREAVDQKPESWLSVLFVDNAQCRLPAWMADKRPKGFDFNSRPDLGQFPGIEQLDDLWRWIEGLPADKAHALPPAVLRERAARIERIDVVGDPANYANPTLRGRVTFQYGDHLHYTVGHGEYQFNVAFSEHSGDSVYMYSDKGLKAVGLIPNTSLDTFAFETFLRPARAVTPAVGQKVVLMNQIGALCVMTIEAVQPEINDASHTPAAVTFAYEILVGR